MGFKHEIIFQADADTPPEVTREIDEYLVPNSEVGNDSYIQWDSEMGDEYPSINSYFLDNDITRCLILISW